MTTALIRCLDDVDAAVFQALRLRALEDDPASFLASREEEAGTTLDDVRARLREKRGRDDDFVLGAFIEDELVGIAGFCRETRAKANHKATIWGVFVAAEARRLGVGRALVEEAVARARAVPGLLQIHLSVSTTTPEARRLYRALGFCTWGVEPDAMRVAGNLIDEEHMVLLLG